ncbi:hypothetical protein JW935_05545, partial [candidate division KSB1 bacterium]|nr:hypothetical protein [candidate division KSB1 bacterium]
EMFSRIVANKQKLIEIQGSIRGISVHPILESELEARFIEILSQAKFAGKPVAVKKRVVEQKPGWRIEINGHIYDIVPQVELVQTDQVVIPARADFMIYPVKSCLKRPIALFCDGYAWHAGKRKTQSRVGKDMAQRMAIVRSGRFYIWSLTWADLEKRIGTPHYDNFLAYNPTMTLYLEKIFKSRDDQLFFRELEKLNSFELFCKLLGNPEIDNWNTFSVALAVSQIQPEGGQPVLKQTISEFEQVLRHSGSWQDVNFDTVTKQSGGDYFFGITAKDYQDKPKLKLLVSATKTAIQNMSRYEISPCCRFFDDDDIVDQLDFKKAWNGFLRLFNIYQFVPNALFVTSKGLADHEYDHSIYNWIEKEKKPITGGEDFKELYDITDPKYHPVLTYLIKHKLPLPEIGYELLNDKNRVTGQAEMAWPPQKIAFLHEQEMDFKKEFEQKSWQVWELKNILENLSICDTLLRSNKDGK